MSLAATIQAIAELTVGEGADISDAYPVTSLRRTTSVEGPEGQSGVSYRVESWELEVLAFAASVEDAAALEKTVRDDLQRRGERVRVLRHESDALVLGAGGTAGGCLLGFPVVEVADSPRVGGLARAFTVRVTGRVPVDDGGVVEHSWEETERVDEDGKSTVERSGTYRLANGGDARAAVETMIAAARSAAESADDAFASRVTVGPDAALCRYSYTRSPKAHSFSTGIDDAQVEDVTTRERSGRVRRVVSGYAVGDGAAAFAAAQKPTADATNLLLSVEGPTPASTPDGRVRFRYEMLTGAVDPAFTGCVVFSFSETVELVAGGVSVGAVPFLNRAPVLINGRQEAWVYRQVSDIEFAGTSYTAGMPPAAMDEANLAGPPLIAKTGGTNGIKRIRVQRLFIFDAAQTLPDPRQIVGLT